MKTHVKGKQQQLDSENCRLNFKSLPNINRTIKSGRMRLAGHAACMREEKLHAKFWQENLKERDNLEDLGADVSIICNNLFTQAIKANNSSLD
jgi:hypothetical protein